MGRYDPMGHSGVPALSLPLSYTIPAVTFAVVAVVDVVDVVVISQPIGPFS